MSHLTRENLHLSDQASQIASLVPKPVKFDEDWVLISGFVLIFTQVGFALIESGSVRYKNSQSIVIKVILGLFCTLVIWWIFGYGFSFGYDRDTKFLGGSKLASVRWEADEYMNDYANFVLRVTGAAIGVSVISGATAERMTFLAWSILTVLYSGFIYAALVHWQFNKGWLYEFGFKDFSGAGVVFFAAGVASFLITKFLKPRKYRVDSGFQQQSQLHVAFGSLILFGSWLFYNGSLVTAGEDHPDSQGLVCVNTIIAGSAGGLFAFIYRYLKKLNTSLGSLSRGIIAGLVAVCACVNEMDIWVAFIYGALAGLCYAATATCQEGCDTIDDPVEVIPVYLVGGLLGIVLTGLLDPKGGLFYGQGMGLFGIQLLGLLIIALWVGFFVLLILMGLKGSGILRIDNDTEVEGIDKSQCQGESFVFSNNEISQPKEIEFAPTNRSIKRIIQ